MASDRKWWLQLQFAFFQDKRVRALRRKHGDLAMIIYQKMMLKSLEESCTMKFEGLEDTFEEEIAVDIVEDEAEKISLIKHVMDFLIKHELMIEQEDGCYFFPQAAKMSGSESSSAERMRRKRERDKEKQSSQSDGDMSQDSATSDGSISHCDVIKTEQEAETDLHLNSDKSKSLDVKSKTDTEQADAGSVPADQPAAPAAAKAGPPAADLFSVKQLLATAKKNKVNLTEEGVRAFYDEMHESGWILYQKPVEKKGIVKAMRGWAKYHPEYGIKVDETPTSMPDECRKYLKAWLDWRLSCDTNDDYFEIRNCEDLRGIIFDFEHEGNSRETVSSIRKRISKAYEEEFDFLCSEWEKAKKVEK